MFIRSSRIVAVTGMLFVAGCVSHIPEASSPQMIMPPAALPVKPDMAQACINASANKYYLPVRVIQAVNAQTGGDGSTKVNMKVDLRKAICTIDASGNVRSVVDITS